MPENGRGAYLAFTDEGPAWKQFDWGARKHALGAALDQAGPDILCVQEATPPQVAFIAAALSGHQRVGVGRVAGQRRVEGRQRLLVQADEQLGGRRRREDLVEEDFQRRVGHGL